jgi:hypothetical protein
MAKSGEASEEGRPDGDSLEDVLAELGTRPELASQEEMGEGLTSNAEERYKAQIDLLLIYIQGLRVEGRLLRQRIEALETRRWWQPWRRG